MSDRQAAKQVVRDYLAAMDSARTDALGNVMNDFVAQDYSFRGVHPFNEIASASGVASKVWQPLRNALKPMQRRQDIFMAGPNQSDGNMWVIDMGKLMGLFDSDWLGIPSTGKIVFVPYCEFHRVDNGKIAESALWVDIISVMQQVGLTPLPMQTGAELVFPGPQTQDGLLFETQDAAETSKTRLRIDQMRDDFVATYGSHIPAETLRKTWHEDMAWFGPGGFGAAFTIDGFLNQHERPFREGLDDLVFNGHVCNIAEGHYAGWFGWPNLTMTPSGGLMGLPASDRRVHMRIIDIYRRDGDKFAENWIFIDILHWLLQQNLDVLGRMREILHNSVSPE